MAQRAPLSLPSTREQYHANNTIEAYSTVTHYQYSNRQLGAYIIRYNKNGAVIKIILGGGGAYIAVGIYYSAYR